MTDASIVAPDAGREDAQSQLAAGLAKLRRRSGLVVTDRWLLYIGGVLLPLGALLVIAGWYGAAHTTRLFEEVPYLISGGLFGLTLVIIGAAFYFGYWLTRMVSGERQMLDVLLRIEERLDQAAGPAGAAPVARVGGLVATRTGSMFHRPDCPVVADRPASELRAVRLPAEGLSACRICAPD